MYFVYILTNAAGSILYTGVTRDLVGRVWQHKQKLAPGFTAKYNVDRLVYFEAGPDVVGVIEREKQIKGGSRAKKVALIRKMNPEWRDLYVELVDGREETFDLHGRVVPKLEESLTTGH